MTRFERSGDYKDLALPGRRAIRGHAELYVIGGRVFVSNLDWKNGIFIVAHGRREHLIKGYVAPSQVVSFGGYLDRIGHLIELDQRG